MHSCTITLKAPNWGAFPLQTFVIPFLPKQRSPVDNFRLLKMDGGYQNVESSLRQIWKGQRISGDPSCYVVHWDETGCLGRLNIAIESQELKQQRKGWGWDMWSCDNWKKQVFRSGLWDLIASSCLRLAFSASSLHLKMEVVSCLLLMPCLVTSLPAMMDHSPSGAVGPNKDFPISCFWLQCIIRAWEKQLLHTLEKLKILFIM